MIAGKGGLGFKSGWMGSRAESAMHSSTPLLGGSYCVLLTLLSSARLGMQRSNCSVNYLYVSGGDFFFPHFIFLLGLGAQTTHQVLKID